jgi:threonyl-tRNA synthetase
MDFAHTKSALRSTKAPTRSTAKSSAEQMKVYTMFVIGKRDMDAEAASVRVHGKGNLGAKPRGEAIAEILQSIRERRA